MKPNDLFNIHRVRVQRIGHMDACAGKPKDASAYGARPGSAWEKWYGEGYNEAADAIASVENSGVIQ
jgi:hypothetical protein